MLRILVLPATLMLLLTACGPAAENRQQMHEKAKVFQDSLANMIRVQLNEAEGPQPAMPPDTTRPPQPGK